MTDLPNKQCLTSQEVAKMFGIGESVLREIPTRFDAGAKREKWFVEKIIKTWLDNWLKANGYDDYYVEITP